MSVLWLILILGVLKLPLIGLLMWLPFRADSVVTDVPDGPDDGGSKTLPGHGQRGRHPRGPLPRSPRRGPHGSHPAPPPERVRPVRARRAADRCSG